MSLYIEHHNGTVWNREVGDNDDPHEAEGVGDDLVGGDDPEVVEGTPGCLLPGYQLVLTSPIAHSNLYGQIFIEIFLNSPKSFIKGAKVIFYHTFILTQTFVPKRKSDNAKFNDSNKV